MSRTNPWKQKPRHTRHTTLIVVEEDTELALVNYLKGLCGRDCGTRVTPENAHGGSGDVVLNLAIKLCKAYDARACLYDTDRAPTVKKDIRKAPFPAITPLGCLHVLASKSAKDSIFLAFFGTFTQLGR